MDSMLFIVPAHCAVYFESNNRAVRRVFNFYEKHSTSPSNHLLFVWCWSLQCLYLSSLLLFVIDFVLSFFYLCWHRSPSQIEIQSGNVSLYLALAHVEIFPFRHTDSWLTIYLWLHIKRYSQFFWRHLCILFAFPLNFFLSSPNVATSVDMIYISAAMGKCVPPILAACIIGFHHNLKWNTVIFSLFFSIYQWKEASKRTLYVSMHWKL